MKSIKKEDTATMAISIFYLYIMHMQALNQLGSVLYYYTLSIAPISIVSPAVNTTKIVFNLIGLINILKMEYFLYLIYLFYFLW